MTPQAPSTQNGSHESGHCCRCYCRHQALRQPLLLLLLPAVVCGRSTHSANHLESTLV
jgi:hypothetical protein